MYNAYITKLKNLHAHPNADRLQLGECFGNTVCVSLEYTNDMLGLYLPVDGQLSVEFCEANNLVRKKDDSGNNIGGYLDPDKRNIVAICLRGEKSDGLFLPLESLTFTGIDLSSLKEGDVITDSLNGHEICQKYIPRRSKGTAALKLGNKTRKKSVPIAPLFSEHADTEQLVYNLNAFKAGDEIEITLKMHGCFVAGTKVRMADGSLKEIQQIKKGEKVLGYNFKTKKIESAEILNTFKNASSNIWHKIKISRNGIKGDKRGYYTSTPNHPYWSEEKQCWIEAKDLQVGETISTLFPSYILTQQQKDILIGSFLGDGCLLSYENQVAELQNGCKKDLESYIDYFIEMMNGYHYKVAKEYASGYGTSIIRAKTHRSADLYNYFSDVSTFNNQNGKKLLRGLVDKFTPLSLAIFYMEDGSLSHSDSQKDRALFSICDYMDEDDIDIICDCFKKFNIEPTYYKDAGGYSRIRLNTDEAYKMFNLIEKYIPPIMRYKLPIEYRNKEFVFQKDSEEFKKGFILRPQVVLENIKIKESNIEYDLETSLHNYIVGMAIVHNTSQRTGYLPIFKGYKKTLFEKLFRRQGTPIYEYGYISGTRRTVLQDFEGGFYGDNSFRQVHHNKFVGKLMKGETVYYEVVGFTDTGAAIMGDGNNDKLGKDFIKQYGKTTVFSYGCDPDGINDEVLSNGDIIYSHTPKSECYVYRMTMTNEDGFVVEYPPDFMRYRCEQIGVKSVIAFTKMTIPKDEGIFKNFNAYGDAVKEIAERYYDGPDPIGKTHIREGVVCRIVNRPKFTAYKHKNFNFKVLSNIAIAKIEQNDNIDSINPDILEEL